MRALLTIAAGLDELRFGRLFFDPRVLLCFPSPTCVPDPGVVRLCYEAPDPTQAARQGPTQPPRRQNKAGHGPVWVRTGSPLGDSVHLGHFPQRRSAGLCWIAPSELDFAAILSTFHG
jgi:hypothetical protein